MRFVSLKPQNTPQTSFLNLTQQQELMMSFMILQYFIFIPCHAFQLFLT